jgi:protein-S-isoprenylcysteine O-methyltransferase
VEAALALSEVLWVALLIFPVSEIALAIFRRADRRTADVRDRGSMRLLWVAIGLAIALAIAAQSVPAAEISAPLPWLQALALGLLVIGLGLRWYAIVTLGRLFTVDVAVLPEHALVERGPYRFVRHPSYTGLLLAFLALGLYFGNWLSLAALLVVITPAVLRRIAAEEVALRHGLGAPYDAYCARTKRLVPGVY